MWIFAAWLFVVLVSSIISVSQGNGNSNFIIYSQNAVKVKVRELCDYDYFDKMKTNCFCNTYVNPYDNYYEKSWKNKMLLMILGCE